MPNHALNLFFSRARSRARSRAGASRLGVPTLAWALVALAPIAAPGLSPARAASRAALITPAATHTLSRIVEEARAQLAAQPASAPVQLKVERGGRVALPMVNVTRVITDDVDVARASFEGAQAFVEGVSTGSSILNVQTADGRVQTITVEVVPTGSLGTLPATPTQPSTQIAAVTGPAPSAVPSATPSTVPASTPASTPSITSAGPSVKATSPHAVSVRVSTADDNPNQALVSVTYSNSGPTAQSVTVRSPLDDLVSYVTNSATGGPRYDNAARELSWDLRDVPASSTRLVSYRVEAVDRRNVTFVSSANIEGSDGAFASSKSLTYSFVTTPLLTVFALPDRIIAKRTAPVLVDVRGAEAQAAIDRLQGMGVVTGREAGLFFPGAAAQRGEYAVMVLKGLNLRDLRDVTAIKFVLGRQSIVNLKIFNSAGQVEADLITNQSLSAGEKTALWDGRSGTGFVKPGRYKYVCTAKDNARGETTTLSGIITVVAQNPLRPIAGESPFVDVKNGDWYAGYLALAEKQSLIRGYPDKTFRPAKSISRVEAAAMVVRALGLEDLARSQASKDIGFLDYQDIPNWATGYVNVAATAAQAKSASGLLMKGYPSNFFLPLKGLRRDEAALVVQRLIDRDANRRISVSGAMVPGAVVTINNSTIEAADDGVFSFVIEQDSANPVTVTVTDSRN